MVTKSIAWILVVEKDVSFKRHVNGKSSTADYFQAVFQTLRGAGLTNHPDLPGPGVLITVSSAIRLPVIFFTIPASGKGIP